MKQDEANDNWRRFTCLPALSLSLPFLLARNRSQASLKPTPSVCVCSSTRLAPSLSLALSIISRASSSGPACVCPARHFLRALACDLPQVASGPSVIIECNCPPRKRMRQSPLRILLGLLASTSSHFVCKACQVQQLDRPAPVRSAGRSMTSSQVASFWQRTREGEEEEAE